MFSKFFSWNSVVLSTLIFLISFSAHAEYYMVYSAPANCGECFIRPPTCHKVYKKVHKKVCKRVYKKPHYIKRKKPACRVHHYVPRPAHRCRTSISYLGSELYPDYPSCSPCQRRCHSRYRPSDSCNYHPRRVYDPYYHTEYFPNFDRRTADDVDYEFPN